MMLSSMQPGEIVQAIVEENVAMLRTIKGIGAKTAQLVVLQLKDKLSKWAVTANLGLSAGRNAVVQEALTALLALGIAKPMAQKALEKVLQTSENVSNVEVIIKKALKNL